MGYEMNSPVRQVWLPIEYDFLNEHRALSFGQFASAYKEEYGIDLHDIFKLVKSDNDEYAVLLKVGLVSAYSAKGLYGDASLNSKLVQINCVGYKQFKQGQTESASDMILCGINNGETVGWGFMIRLPSTETVINSIDDLQITFLEI